MKNPGDIRDEILVLRAQSGESDALAALVESWQPRLWAFARVLTGDDQAAWDITQETWLAVLRDLPRLQDCTRFRPWLFRIVRNKTADKARRATRDRKFLQEQARDAEPRTFRTPDGMRDALAALPEPDAAVLALHYLEGASYEELAAILSVPLGTVKSRLHNARAKLRNLLENP